MDVKIRFTQPFTDGNILDKHAKIGQEMIVSERILHQLKQSGADIQEVERYVPKSQTEEVIEKNSEKEPETKVRRNKRK